MSNYAWNSYNTALTFSPLLFQGSCGCHWPANQHVAHKERQPLSAASDTQTVASSLHVYSSWIHRARQTEPLLSEMAETIIFCPKRSHNNQVSKVP